MDAIHRGTGRKPILPDRCALIIDEAHKLPEAAREMFGITLEAGHFQAMARNLRAERYLLAAEYLSVLSKPLIQRMSLLFDEDGAIADFTRLLVGPSRGLAVIQRQLRCLLTPVTRGQLEKLTSTVLLFRDRSYAALSAACERLAEQPWPVFALGRNSVHTVEQFKTTPGSVLLAAGAAWEGFDFPGDSVSLLIIPRLPFPRPDARKEKERENYPTLCAFIRSVIVPEMPLTNRILDVETFIHAVKGADYFESQETV